MAIVAGVGVLGMLALIAAIVVVKRIDSPAEVPSDFRSPTTLPESGALPDDTMWFDSDRTGNFEIFAATLAGTSPRQITDDERFDSWWPRISPDRQTILFHRSPRGVHDRDFRKVSLWAMAADGTSPVELRPPGMDGWSVQGHVEWHPGGERLVMFGGSGLSPQIFVTAVNGTEPRQLTDRGGRNLDPVYSQDGRRIWFVGCPASICQDDDQEIYSLDVDERGERPTGEPRRMTDDRIRDNDPYESPDGRHLGWLSQFGTEGIGIWDVRIADIGDDGQALSKARRLTNDRAVTSRPQWSADGRSVTTHRLEVGAAAFDLARIDVESGAVTRLEASSTSNDEYPSL